jgi:integrative and conjugative element protein (TIGR02256 family)
MPDYDYQEEEIARVYRDLGRLFTYLGDWHTHPDGRLHLSAIDRKTLKRIADHPAARIHNPVMILLAGGNPWRLGAWRWGASLLRPFGSPRSVPIRVWD